MTNDSFTFAGVDMYTTYGIRMLHYDTLLPALRQRKLVIPTRSGAYDYGAKYYDERIVRVECDTRRTLTKAQIRELAYTLSTKGQLRFWNEPDLYYVGRIYDTAELNYIGAIGYEFNLTFVCEPFAYGEYKTEDFEDSVVSPDYRGSSVTPTKITITNTGDTDAVGIQVTITKRR